MYTRPIIWFNPKNILNNQYLLNYSIYVMILFSFSKIFTIWLMYITYSTSTYDHLCKLSSNIRNHCQQHILWFKLNESFILLSNMVQQVIETYLIILVQCIDVVMILVEFNLNILILYKV